MKLDRLNPILEVETSPEVSPGFMQVSMQLLSGDWKPPPWKCSAQLQKELAFLFLFYSHLVATATAISFHPYSRNKSSISEDIKFFQKWSSMGSRSPKTVEEFHLAINKGMISTELL